MANAKRDENDVPTLLGVSNVDGTTPVTVYADPVTHRLLVSSGSSVTYVNSETPSGTIDGSNATFTLAHIPASNTLLLFLNGQFQHPTSDYTLSGSTITYVSPPPAQFSGLPFTAIYNY